MALLCALMPLCLHAQVSTARFEGTVIDQSGAVVPGATVTAVNSRTKATATVTADSQGHFIFASLPNSIYTMTAEASGFRKAQLENVELNASATVSETIRMEIGSTSEVVTVEAASVRVNTTDAQIGRSVTLRDIDTLPQLGRGPLALAVFQPGVSIDPGDTTFSRINGARQGSNNSKLDGIDVNDAVVPRFGLSMTAINVDSVEEMRVITNGGKAEYGRNAGGQVEMITRSGTNRWSGSAFEYLRNTKLNANNFFNNSSGISRPTFIQNIYGTSLGGPVKRDKWFVFGNWQSRRTTQQTVRTRTVLTPEAKAGVFRWRAPGSTAISSFDIPRNDPRSRGIDPAMRDIFALLPNPNNFDLGDGLNTAGFRFNNPSGSFEDQWTIKSDYQLSSMHRVFYRHSWQRNESIDALNNADARFPGRPQGAQGGRRWGYSIGSDWVITPTWINEFRLGRQRANVDFIRPDRPRGAAYVSNTFTDPINPAFAQGRSSPVWDVTENLSHLSGKHTYKLGFTTRRVLQFGYNDAGIFPDFNLGRANNNLPAAAIGPSGGMISSADRQRFEELYNDTLGRVSSIATTFYSNLREFQPAGTGRVRNLDFADYAGFFQDDWRVRSNLVLNLGLRWEFFGSPTEQGGFQGTVEQAAAITPAAQIADLRVARAESWFRNDLNNLAPRFGFAWDPFKDGKLAIRGAYGIFFDRIIGATANVVDANTPGFTQGVTLFPNASAGSDVRIADRPALPGQPPAPVLQQPVTRVPNISVFSDRLATGYVQQMNLNIQREILRNTVVDVGYVRTHGVKLFTWLNYNQPRIAGDFLNAFREIEAFRASGRAPSAANTLVRIFGTPQAAINSIGATTFQQGLAGAAADTVDRSNYQRYAAAGVSQFYLRNLPQYNQIFFGGNDGRSWYDSLQVSLRRSAGALKFSVNYTWSKTLDNTSLDGNGFTSTIDNFNLRLNRGRGDADRPHAFNYTTLYSLPFGRGKKFASGAPGWANQIIGGWELGVLGIWQSGGVLTFTSGRRTTGSTLNAWANYSGDRNIGSVERRGNGVFYLTADEVGRFAFPAAGEIGTGGRNAFRGPRFFNIDASVVKRFPLFWERHTVTFRAELYNAINNVNFGGPGTSLVTPQNLGRISGTVGNPRIMQMALRYDF